MSAIDDIITTIAEIREKIGEATGVAEKAGSNADTAIGVAEELGSTSMVEGLSALKEQLETISVAIQGIAAQLDEADGAAQELSGSS